MPGNKRLPPSIDSVVWGTLGVEELKDYKGENTADPKEAPLAYSDEVMREDLTRAIAGSSTVRSTA
jgi:hypothetical protein